MRSTPRLLRSTARWSCPAGPAARCTSGSDALGAGRCDSVVVDPATLALSNERSGSCDDPRLYGVNALVVNSFINGNQNGANVRIAHTTPQGYVLGPIVMTYTELSDTDAEWVYGDGFLWVYFSLTTSHGSELLRVSATTGTVVQTVRMPPIDRPLIAADADGFWLVPAFNSSGHGLYNVAPGATQPALVSTAVGYGANWMVASGHSVWMDVNHYPKHATLLRFDGTKLALHVTSEVIAVRPESRGAAEQKWGWRRNRDLDGARQKHLVRIEPNTAQTSNVARLPGAHGQPEPRRRWTARMFASNHRIRCTHGPFGDGRRRISVAPGATTRRIRLTRR